MNTPSYQPNISIIVRFTAEGFHRWPGASGGRSYLAHPHRHLFHVEVKVSVFHQDREVEFHDLLKFARESFGSGDFGYDSCETLASRLALTVSERYPLRDVCVSCFEDGEVGATLVLDRSAARRSAARSIHIHPPKRSDVHDPEAV